VRNRRLTSSAMVRHEMHIQFSVSVYIFFNPGRSTGILAGSLNRAGDVTSHKCNARALVLSPVFIVYPLSLSGYQKREQTATKEKER
jgi:hypothetical protein